MRNKNNSYIKPLIKVKKISFKLLFGGYENDIPMNLLAGDCPGACGPGWCSDGTAYCCGTGAAQTCCC